MNPYGIERQTPPRRLQVLMKATAICRCLVNVARNSLYGPNFRSVDLSVIKNISIREPLKLQLRADMLNVFNRINLASGTASVAVGGVLSPNFNTCAEDVTAHHCTSANGFGMVTDTIGDFNGAPGLRPGEQFNMQLVIKLIW